MPVIKLELDAENGVKAGSCSDARDTLSLSVVWAFGRVNVHLLFGFGFLSLGLHYSYK